MRKILVPISFSNSSKNALVNAYSVAKRFGSKLSLLHCYPYEKYNREHNFGKSDYDIGIRKMLAAFYNECIEEPGNYRYDLITYAGSVSDIVSEISHQYDLMVMSRKTGFQAQTKGYSNDTLFYLTTKSRCPVLITCNDHTDFSFHEALNIWHIERNEMEKDIVHDGLRKLRIDPTLVVTKALTQERYISNFWKNITTYTKTHDAKLLKSLPELFDEEHIELMILVNRMKGMFEIFLKNEAFQIINQFDIPILIFQTKPSK